MTDAWFLPFLFVAFNQIELIGYGAGGDSLFLVYEFAQNGALSDHLHNPTLRGLVYLMINSSYCHFVLLYLK